jgi:HrpA-like RNA helicase
MTGQEEIESTVRCIRDISKDMVRDIPPLVVCPLYAALPSHQQLKVFNETPQVIANCVKSK